MIGDVFLVLARIAAGWLPVGRVIERPGATARDRQEFCGRAERQLLVEVSADIPGAHARALGRDIEQGAAPDIEALGDPEIGQRQKGRPAD
jgi:hypothetical protein